MDTKLAGGAEVPVEESDQDQDLPEQQEAHQADGQYLPVATKADSERWENLQNNIGNFTAKGGFWFEDQEIGWCWTEDRRNVISSTLLCEDLIGIMRAADPTPRTEIIARLCSKMDPEQRLWFLTRAKDQDWDPDTIQYEAENRVGQWGQHPKPIPQELWRWGKDKKQKRGPERAQSSTRQAEPEPQPQGHWQDFSQGHGKDAMATSSSATSSRAQEDELKNSGYYSSHETREYYNQRPVDNEACHDLCSRRLKDDPINHLQHQGLCVLPCCLGHRHEGAHFCRTCNDENRTAEGHEDMELNPNEPIDPQRAAEEQTEGLGSADNDTLPWPQAQQAPEPYISPTRRPYQSAAEQVPLFETWSALEPNRPRRTYPPRGEGEEDDDPARKHRMLN